MPCLFFHNRKRWWWLEPNYNFCLWNANVDVCYLCWAHLYLTWSAVSVCCLESLVSLVFIGIISLILFYDHLLIVILAGRYLSNFCSVSDSEMSVASWLVTMWIVDDNFDGFTGSWLLPSRGGGITSPGKYSHVCWIRDQVMKTVLVLGYGVLHILHYFCMFLLILWYKFSTV